MPIEKKNETGLSLGIPFNQVDNLTPQAAKPTPSAPGILETIDAGLRQGNWLTQAVHGERNPYKDAAPNAAYNPFEDPAVKGYEDHYDWFATSNSPEESAWRARKLDTDLAEKDILKRAGGWGTTAELVGSLFTPDILIGGGAITKTMKAGKYAKAAVEGASVGALSGTLYGAGQNIRDESRDTMDVVKDAGAFSLAGSLLSPAVVWGAGKLIGKAATQTVPPVAPPAHVPTPDDIRIAATQLKQSAQHSMATVPVDMEAQAQRLSDEIMYDSSSAARQLPPDAPHVPPAPKQPYVAPTVADTNLVGSFGANKINLNQSMVTLSNSSFTEFKLASQKLFRDMRMRVGNLDGSFTNLQSAESELERLAQGAIGKGHDDFNKAFKEYNKTGWETPQTLAYVQQKYGKNKMTMKEFDEEIGVAMSNADRHAIGEVQRVAQTGRTVTDSLAAEAERFGLLDRSGNLKGTAQSYFGRNFNKDKIIAQQTAFRLMLANEFQRTNPLWTRQQLEDAAQNVYEQIIHGSNDRLINVKSIHIDTDGNIIPLGNKSKTSVAMERKLEIDDNILEPFLNKSYRDFIQRYSNTVGADVALTKMLGDTTGSAIMERALLEKQSKLAAIETDMTLSALEKEAAFIKLEADFEKGRKAIQNGIDIMTGAYKNGPDSIRAWTTAAHVATTFSYITKMGSAPISSLGDFTKSVLFFGMAKPLQYAMPALRQGLGDIFRMPSIKDPLFDTMVQANKRLGVGMEIVLHTRHAQINDLVDKYSGPNPVIKGLDWMGDKMGIWNGLAHLTDFQKQMVGVISNDEIIRSVIAETAGNASERELRNLRVWGIDQDMSRRISDEFTSGLTAGHNILDRGFHVTDTLKWADKDAAETLERALVTMSHTIVYNPSAGAKIVTPFDKGTESMMTQFMSFNFGSHIQHFTQMMQQVHEKDASVVGYIVASLMVGASVYELKSALRRSGYEGEKGEQKERNFKEWAYDTISESSLAPVPFLLNGFSSGVGLGDARRLLSDDDRPTLSASNFNGGVVFGASAQLAKDAFEIASDIKNDTEDKSTISAARRLIPFQNLSYLRTLFNMGEERAQDYLDLPDRATSTFTIRK